MTPPTFRDLTFDELLGRGWQAQSGSPVQQPDGTYRFTLVLPGEAEAIIHAVTGDGTTGEDARRQAVDTANQWRRIKAGERSQEKDGEGKG